MLINEPLVAYHSNDPILSLLSEGFRTTRLRTGVYEVGHFGSSSFLHGAYEQYAVNLGEGSPYGVCDSVDDILRVYPILEASQDRKFVVTLRKVTRDLSNKGRGGGWRWHKWGAYIGTQEPTTEYLDDEPEIEQVYCFHIYEKIEAL